MEKKLPFLKFQNAVKLRLRSDVELGFALSGGIDSSSIVCMSNLIDGSTKKTTFSIVYPGETIDESQFIDEVIQKTKFEKASITPEFKDFKSDLSDFIYFQEEPVPDLSYYNEYRLRKFIKEKKVIVTLEGQGADEVITGYRSFVLPFYFDLIISFRFKKLRNEMKAFSHFYKIKMSELIIRFLLSKIPKSIFLKIKRFYKKKSNGLINQNYFKINNKPTEKKYGNRQLNSALLNSLLINSIPKQLNRADKSAMAFSLECRFPFLDNKLVEYCFGLDDNKKMINGITKHILRSSMKKYLPKKIFKRKDKIGFISPQSKWLRSLSDFFDDIVYSESFKERPYINWKKFEKKYTEFRDNKNDDSKELWKIFGVFLWEQNFFKIDR
jgi:asparagine synthase (glutamine-hydrolysing)